MQSQNENPTGSFNDRSCAEEQFYRALFENGAAGIWIWNVGDACFAKVNRRTADMLGYDSPDELVGLTPADISPEFQPDGRSSEDVAFEMIGIAAEYGRASCEWVALKKDGTPVWLLFEVVLLRTDRGMQIYGIVIDITDQKRAEELRKLNESRLRALLHLNQMTTASLQELADFALEEAIELTGSTVGYLAFANEDQTRLTMFAWSKAAMQLCGITDKPIEYPLETCGLWAEAMRQKRPIITNDYSAPNPLKRGLPEGHVELRRHLSVPIMDGERVVAVAGVGNKEEPYDDTDADQLTLLIDGMWRLLERRRAGEAFAEAEARYRALAENSPVGVYMFQNMRLAYVNPSLAAMTGYDRDELIGRHILDFIAPECHQRIEYMYANPTNPTHFPLKLICRDGRALDVEVFDMDVVADGAPASIGTIIDITKRLAADHALRESEERYRTLVETSSDAINLISLDGRMIMANRAACEDHGWRLDEVVGRSIFDFIIPEDHQRAVVVLDTILREGSAVFEGTALAGDGSVWPFEAHSAAVRNSAGEPTAIVSVLRDLTERRVAEEAMRLYSDIVRNMQTGLYVYHLEDPDDDRTLRLTAANPASSTGLGIPEQGIVGRYIDDVFPGLRARGIPQRFAEVVRTGEPFSLDDFVYDDSRVAHGCFSFKAFAIPGNHVGVLFEDITRLKRAEEEKRQFYRETISSVTDGKLQIVDADETAQYIGTADLHMDLHDRDNTAAARIAVEEYCREKGLSDYSLCLMMTGFGEALTNAIKHAGSGTFCAGVHGHEIWVAVQDNGAGISTLLIPKATLRKGYSTKASLGMGYSIMLDAADRLLLCTGDEGTTVILTKSLFTDPGTTSREAPDDIWDSV